MLKNIWLWILTNVFKVQTITTNKEIDDNVKYAKDYNRIDDINFNAIFSNKLANYVISDSNMNIEGDNARTELLSKTGQSIWKKGKKITSMAFGYGGVALVPYVKGGKIFYSIVPQDRITIDDMQGDLITGATILAEKRVINSNVKQTIYLRWTNYQIQNNNMVITQQYSDEDGNKIPAPTFWKDIQEVRTITNVDRVLFGFIKSPINNRKSNDKYGVPITYGCDATIDEIKDTLKQLYQEFTLKQTFVGADATLFGKNGLPNDGLFKKFNSTEDDFFEVYDPQFRSYSERLQELYQRLEHEIGTSGGIISEVKTNNATATEIKHAMYDTFTLCDDMRSNIEKGFDDFFYACNVLANAFNLSPNGEYNVSYDWSYSLLEDTQTEWNQLVMAQSKGIVSKVELRQWLNPDESLEDAQKNIDEIKKSEPSVSDLIGE